MTESTESKEASGDSKKGTIRLISSTPLPPAQIQRGSQRAIPTYSTPEPRKPRRWFRWFGRANPAAQE